MKKQLLLAICTLITLVHQLNSQTLLWEENFESYATYSGIRGINGTYSGDYPASTSFSINAVNTDFNDSANDYIAVKTTSSNKQLEARDLDGEAIITFNSVDISSETGDITIRIDDLDFNATSSSVTWSNPSYVDIEYSFDNGDTFTKVANYNSNGDADHTFIHPLNTGAGEDVNHNDIEITVNPGSATAIIVRLKINNTGSNEELEFDEIEIIRNNNSIWLEDFESYVDDSGIVGTGSTVFTNIYDYPSNISKWTLTLNDPEQLINSHDYIKILENNNNKHLFFNDINDQVIFETENINISGETEVTFGMDIAFKETSYESDDFFDIYYSTDNGATYTLALDDGTGHSYAGSTVPNTAGNLEVYFTKTLSNLSSTNLKLKIIAKNNSNTEDFILDNLKVVSGNTLSIKNQLLSDVTIYPNPTTPSFISIKTKLNSIKTISITNLIGKTVLSLSTTNSKININKLKTGVYLLKIEQDNKIAVKKLIIK